MKNKQILKIFISFVIFIIFLIISFFSFNHFSEYFFVLSLIFWGLLLLQKGILEWKKNFIINFIGKEKLKRIFIFFSVIYLILSILIFQFVQGFNLMMFFCFFISLFNLSIYSFLTVLM